MAGLVSPAVLFVLLSLVPFSGALAAGDPTRPPATWLSQADAHTAGGGTSLRLQSVLLPQRGRPVAIIDGQTVPLGSYVGVARLVRLTEGEAVLQGPDGVTRLYLTPDVDKRMTVAPAANKARQAAQGKENR